MRRILAFCLALLFCACSTGCGTEPPAPKPEKKRLTVYSTLSSPLLEILVNEYEKQRGVRVDLIAGDALMYPEDAGEADVILGLPPELAAEHRANLRIYASLNEYNLQRELQTAEDCVTCFAVCANVLLVNTNLLGSTELKGYADLLRPELKGQVALPHPKYSATGYGHLINMLAAMGDEQKGWSFMQRLVSQGLQLPVETAAAAARDVALGKVTVALTTENAAREQVEAGAPVRIVYMQEGVLTYPIGVSIAEWTPSRHEAEDFVDFLTGRSTQSVLMRQLNFRPVRSDIVSELPEIKTLTVPGGVFKSEPQRREQRIAAFQALLVKRHEVTP